MRFIARFKSININESAWRKQLNALLTKEIKRAATAWLNATVLSVIPIWSGASRATFTKLARAVSFPLTITGIKATSGDNPKALGPSVGIQKSRGSVSANEKSGRFTFTYGTTLFHLVFNESNNANQSPGAGKLYAKLLRPGPYNFQEIDKVAFEFYAQTNVELPSPWNKLKTKSLRAG